MPDYGHALLFGSFITPVNAPAQTPVALAQLSEQLGYDLVTFQDHPYQAAFHDTLTLMTWVAAQTESIHISANVLNLPLRPPAVMARAAASLDLLSGGRFELGLGAGGFWDAIASMGGRRLAPGQSVEALEEAIAVIRGIWAADERGGLRVDGEYYSVAGAKRGPAPAHDIPIWLGAYKPRMLRLIGRAADGWLPSYGYMQPGDFAAGNGTIDAAATEAGRDPREIRRLLNITGRFSAASGGFLQGPAEQWVEQLLPLVIDDGAGTFILGSDDPRQLQQFAEEVAPALREAVTRERSSAGTVTGGIRSAIALAKRVDGIDYDGLPAALLERAIEPGDFGYGDVRNTYMRGGAPGLVLRPRATAELAEALEFARAQAVTLSVRSGGHGISGRSTNHGGIILDLGAFNQIEVLDETTRRVRIGAGARWMDVAAALEQHGWALSSGDYGGVGVGGLATAGGVGWLVREHGLTIDSMVAVEVLTAEGMLVRASADENAELFWGMRGAGANFGIATAFEFEVHDVGQVGWAQLAVDANDTAGFLERWGAAVEAAPRDVTSFVIMGAARQGQQVATIMTLVDSDDPDTIIDRLQPFAATGPLLGQDVSLTTYAQVMANVQPGPHRGQGEPNARSGLLTRMTPEFAAAAAAMLSTGDVYFFSIRSMGGAVADVATDATAFAHRDAQFAVSAIGGNNARLDAAWAPLREYFDGLYLSFETDQHADRVSEAFPPATLERLRTLKRRYDPQNVFRDNFNVDPAGS